MAAVAWARPLRHLLQCRQIYHDVQMTRVCCKRGFANCAVLLQKNSVAVTEDHVAAYTTDGIVHLPGIFDPEWVDRMREAFSAAMENPGPYAEYMSSGVTWNNLFEDGAHRRKDLELFQDQLFFEEAEQRVPAWASIVRDSPAAAISARLMGSATATFFYAHLILKCGGADKPIPWHQDLPYWKVDGAQVGSVWVALDDMPFSASVRYIRGSHRWGLYRPAHFVDASPYEGRDDLPLLPNIEELAASGEAEVLAFEVKAGDAVCFDARIVHGSPGNPENVGHHHRRVAFRFCGDNAFYCDRKGETAIPTPEIDKSHGLIHGQRLLCKTFPRVYDANSL
eukprot:TRINITY_DN73506_c0_g1_i1.p1 TRINITY_DN73506_c0_g1~~TRINITY_DN73506_c0_g1_i1.p1  ORF type:complete len:361 (+),score=34.25 TRINITY_DN73506_c0_g1_i1:71-1084(+)